MPTNAVLFSLSLVAGFAGVLVLGLEAFEIFCFSIGGLLWQIP
jgi:hypothetical protein